MRDIRIHNFIMRSWILAFLALLLIFPNIAGASKVSPIYLSISGTDHGQRHKPKHESEHRPTPIRKYRLVAQDLSHDTKAYVVHPDGSLKELPIRHDKTKDTVAFKTPFGEGPMHGIHNTYVVDKKVDDGELIIRVAKWMTIHHNCGWGHEHKYNESRLSSKVLDRIPFEIVAEGLWDGNFHSTVRSGDMLTVKTVKYGKPLKGSKVRITTSKGWTKEVITNDIGEAQFQLIRDYYPEKWIDFNSRQVSSFNVTAEYIADESGEYAGEKYNRIKMVTSLPWRHYPSRTDYSSYSYGLLIATLSLVITGAGVFIYRERRKKPFREVSF